MTIEDDIRAWAGSRPAWQQKILVGLADGHEFSDDEVELIADRLTGTGNPDAGSSGASPSIKASGDEQVQLVSITGVSGVNALIEGETLTFEPNGLTVIYGDNGSGKSGYARLVKNMIKSRDDEPVLGNVFDDSTGPPTAELAYTVGGTPGAQQFGEPVPAEMQRMAFYDVNCGEQYISTVSNVTYRPPALMLLDGLIAVCERVNRSLKARIEALDRDALHLDLPGETFAATFVSNLTAATTSDQIDRALELAPTARDEYAAAVREEARLRNTDPSKEKTRLARLVDHASALAASIGLLLDELGTDRVAARLQAKQKAADLRAAADLAARQAFEDAPVQGVGSETWRVLWEAARAYSVAEAYHTHEFPVTGGTARCVLCHQSLSDEANTRMDRFEAFVQDETARQAVEAEGAYQRSLEVVRSLAIESADHTRRISALADVDAEVSRDAEGLLRGLVERRKAVVEYLVGNGSEPAPLAASEVPTRLRNLAGHLQSQADSLDVDAFDKAVTGVAQRRAELQASFELNEASGKVHSEVARLQRLERLSVARADAGTGPITSKSTDLMRKYVTEKIQASFASEVKHLGLENVTLRDLGGKKGQMRQQPGLVGTDSGKAKVERILSEGEQTALGLAGFFTEATIDTSHSALVFDDPVTSMDHVRRGNVAARIARFARDRQVVVFTHDLSFVVDLSKAASAEAVGFQGRAIERKGKRPGACVAELPWKAKDFGPRKNQLETELDALRNERDGLTTSEWEEKVALWAGKLSELWERCISTEIIDQLFDPGTAETRVMKLRLVGRFTEDDDKDYQQGYGLTSVWAKRHDKALIMNYVPPEPDVMGAELKRIAAWQKQVKGYLKSP